MFEYFKGEEKVLLFLIDLHGTFRDNERRNYEAGVVDFAFIEWAKTTIDGRYDL
jgi:hypothetical protein